MPQSFIQISELAASRLYRRIDELAAVSESIDGLTRRFATPQHKSVNKLVSQWMASAGMSTLEDAIGNVIGKYEANEQSKKGQSIMLGSHLDTVINAGKFDGMLGVLSAIACVETLHEQEKHLDYAIEVVGFADEEGVRYQSTYLGSRAITGQFNPAVLERVDDDGISFPDALTQFGSNPDQLSEAVRRADELAAYLELHIEQGPVLESKNLPVGIVTGIAGAIRLNIQIIGDAGHAGTVPMHLRRDALAAAAHCIQLVESHCSGSEGLVGTVGRINAKPGAVNVIPGEVHFSVDIRALSDCVRVDTEEALLIEMEKVCEARKVSLHVTRVHEAGSVACDDDIMNAMQSAISASGQELVRLPSGAGHDAAAMAAITKIGMLFVRCKDGVSHHPDEFVSESDALAGANVLLNTVLTLNDEL